jgi:arylsulfatase A-like enzyme
MKPYSFYRNRGIDRETVDQKEINRILTDEVLGFIDENKDEPFFAYYASPWPHYPVSVGKAFEGKSEAGLYGDCLEEFDAGLGEIFAKLEAEGILDDTLILFTSDNGPWYDGSTGGLRGRKNNNFNGGQQVPFIAAHPSLLQGGRVQNPAMNIDLFPTILTFCGVDILPDNRQIDGVDILPLLTGAESKMDRELFFVSGTGKITGVLQNEFKYFESIGSENAAYPTFAIKKHLYRLDTDRQEAYDVYDFYPEQAKRLEERLAAFIADAKASPRK